MLCLTDFNKSFDFEDFSSLVNPLYFRRIWVLDTKIMDDPNLNPETLTSKDFDADFVLYELQYIDRTQSAAVKLKIANVEFWVPADWEILIVDRDTFQVDTINVLQCSATNCEAFLFSTDEQKLISCPIEVVDYSDEMVIHHPHIPKSKGLVHPCGEMYNGLKNKHYTVNVVISPNDLGKDLTNYAMGDLIF